MKKKNPTFLEIQLKWTNFQKKKQYSGTKSSCPMTIKTTDSVIKKSSKENHLDGFTSSF